MVIGTILQVFIEKKYIDKIETPGSIIIQGKYLLDIIRKLPDGIITSSFL